MAKNLRAPLFKRSKVKELLMKTMRDSGRRPGKTDGCSQGRRELCSEENSHGFACLRGQKGGD